MDAHKPTPEMILTARDVSIIATAKLRLISNEMRTRKVNHGKALSPTLIAWAARIDAECDRIEEARL